MTGIMASPPRERSTRVENAEHDGVPAISQLVLRAFTWYVRRYARCHFDAVLLDRECDVRLPPHQPAIVFMNHASWWDPLIGLLLARSQFPERQHFAPIDAQSLAQFRFFGKMGLFGIEMASYRGARQFWRTSRAVLARSNSMLWITPQARFADPRQRPPHFAPGLAHLAADHPGVPLIPCAIEYPFWNERLPVALARFGTPILSSSGGDVDDLRRRLETALADTQDALADQAMQRDAGRFHALLQGKRRVSVVYDAWRRLTGRGIGHPLGGEEPRR